MGNLLPPPGQDGSLGQGRERVILKYIWAPPNMLLPQFRMREPLLHSLLKVALSGLYSRSGVMGAGWHHVSAQFLIFCVFAGPNR